MNITQFEPYSSHQIKQNTNERTNDTNNNNLNLKEIKTLLYEFKSNFEILEDIIAKNNNN